MPRMVLDYSALFGCRLSSMAGQPLLCHSPAVEAWIGPARFCAGGVQRWASLPRSDHAGVVFQVHAELGRVVRVPQLDLPLICSPPSWSICESVAPFRHAALRRIRRNLTVQVLVAMPADPGTGSHIRMMQRPRLAYVLDSLPGIPAEHRDADRRNDPRYGVHLMPPWGRGL